MLLRNVTTTVLLYAVCLLSGCDSRQGDALTSNSQPSDTPFSGAVSCDDVKADKYLFTAAPWPPTATPPTTIAAAHRALDAHLSLDQKQQLACLNISRNDMHMGLALWIRNEWNLYAMSPLAERLLNIGFRSADEASSGLAWTYVAQLRQRPIDIADEVARYQP